jgi:hydroxymethylbilane synthase
MLRIGSRGSKLALWQAGFIQQELSRSGNLATEIAIIKTSGDQFQQAPVGQMGLKGVFIKELEDALLERRVDFAVHSMKDVPTEIPNGLRIAAVCRRADARDCLVSRGAIPFRLLPQGARVGTSSLRRRSQLLNMRADLQVEELRGNVDTRLAKLDRGDYDAIVLAKAGMDRLGWSERIAEVFSPEQFLPAVGQGALGIECRAGDSETLSCLSSLDHEETRLAVTAERALLARLEGGCQVPLGAYARVQAGQLRLIAAVLTPDGAQGVRDNVTGPAEQAAELGEQLALLLLSRGADRILQLAGREVHGR